MYAIRAAAADDPAKQSKKINIVKETRDEKKARIIRELEALRKEEEEEEELRKAEEEVTNLVRRLEVARKRARELQVQITQGTARVVSHNHEKQRAHSPTAKTTSPAAPRSQKHEKVVNHTDQARTLGSRTTTTTTTTTGAHGLRSRDQSKTVGISTPSSREPNGVTRTEKAKKCTVCQGLSKRAGPDSQFIGVDNINPRDLQRAIRAGCPTCKLLLDGSSQFITKGESIISISINPAAPSFLPKVCVNIGGGKSFDIEFHTPPGSPQPFPDIDFAHPVSSTVGSDMCVQWTADCIAHCAANHEWCQLPEATKLPTRLVDVGSSTRNPRIYVTNGELGKYAALSHCWGDGTPLKLTKGSLQAMQEEIPVDSLTPLFSDAVVLARRLDIAYIWIDSLCIIQDDRDDWDCEAVKMGDVYADAWVVFAAHTAKDSSESLLSVPRAASTQSVALECEGLNGIRGTVHARLAQTRSHFIDRTHGHARIRDQDRDKAKGSVLSGRGWVFQERKLATRTLHFTCWEVVWECGTEIRCECGYSPSGTSDGRVLKRNFTGPQWVQSQGTFVGESTEISEVMVRGIGTGSADIRNEWPLLVEGFTGRALTFENDRLPAMSGLASSMQRLTSAKYLFGLWSDDLPRGLLWATNRNSWSRSRRSSNVPSWSWASVTGPILAFVNPTFNFRIEVLEFGHSTQHRLRCSGDPSERIKVSGCVVDGRLSTAGSTSSPSGSGSAFEFEDDTTGTLWRVNGELQLDVGDGPAELLEREPCSFLLGSFGSGVVLWLVLKKQSGYFTTYRRIGRFLIKDASRKDWLVEVRGGRNTGPGALKPELLHRIITLV